MQSQNPVVPVSKSVQWATLLFPPRTQSFTRSGFLAGWVAARCIGMLVSMLVWSLPIISSLPTQFTSFARYLGPDWVSPWAAVAAIMLAGITESSAEWWALRRFAPRAGWWIVATGAGAAASAYLAVGPYILEPGGEYRSGALAWGSYPFVTAIPFAITQTLALLVMSERRVHAALWMVARPVLWSGSSFCGGMFMWFGLYPTAGTSQVLAPLAVTFTLFAGIPSAVLTGLYLGATLHRKDGQKGSVALKMPTEQGT